MIQSFYSGAAGLKAHEKSMEVVSNNIANVNTTSYKSKKQSFGALLRVSEVRPETANSENLLAGAGTALNEVKSDMSGGSANITDKNTDFFIENDGFFAVRDNTGKVFYTRDGSFNKVITPNGNILANAAGLTVLGRDGNPVAVNNNGTVGVPAVFTFSNAPGLSNAGGNLYETTVASGNAALSQYVPYKGALERSNVDLSDEMVNMISCQRGLQLNSRLVTTADSIEGMINDLNR